MKKIQLAIIGSGPAGYSAAIYTSRAKLQTTMYAGFKIGGQLMYTTEVENFPGFSQGITGPKLMTEMMQQAQRFGTEIVYEFVTAVDFSQRPFKLWTTLPKGVNPDVFEQSSPEEIVALSKKIKAESEPTATADAVIVATGAVSIYLGIPGEKEFLSKGVSTCAVCDAAFFKEKVTYVIGGGDSAMEDALALAKFAKSVTVIHRRDSFKASKIMQDRVLNHPNISVMWNTQLKKISGKDVVESVEVLVDGEVKVLPAEGVFLAIGHKPMTTIFSDELVRDAHGYVVTRQSATEAGVTAAQSALKGGLVGFPTMTSVEGVFAAGDHVDVRYKQAITAAGQGCMAALDAERWLETQ